MRGIAPESCYSALNLKGCFQHVFFFLQVIVDIFFSVDSAAVRDVACPATFTPVTHTGQ